MQAKDMVKGILKNEGVTLTELAEMLGDTTLQNLSNKLSRNTIQYSQMLEIMHALGYEIVAQKSQSYNCNCNNSDETHIKSVVENHVSSMMPLIMKNFKMEISEEVGLPIEDIIEKLK